jgi:hypothetical protein
MADQNNSDPSAVRRGGSGGAGAWNNAQHENNQEPKSRPASQENASQAKGGRGWASGSYSPSTGALNDPQDGGRKGDESGGPQGNPDPHPNDDRPTGTFSQSVNR